MTTVDRSEFAAAMEDMRIPANTRLNIARLWKVDPATARNMAIVARTQADRAAGIVTTQPAPPRPPAPTLSAEDAALIAKVAAERRIDLTAAASFIGAMRDKERHR